MGVWCQMCLPPGLCPGPRRLPAPSWQNGKRWVSPSQRVAGPRAPIPHDPPVDQCRCACVCAYACVYVWLPPAFASFVNMLMYQIDASKVCPSIVGNVICCIFVIPDDMIRG